MNPTPSAEPVWKATACPMDCPDSCSLEAKVEGRKITLTPKSVMA